MDNTETYEILLRELERLRGELSMEQKSDIFHTYIYGRISDVDIRKALKGKMKKLITVSLPEGLELEPILKQTLKIIALMEVSDNWQEFENLVNKKKKPDKPQDLTDFDKIVKAIFSVPKPKDTDTQEPPK